MNTLIKQTVRATIATLENRPIQYFFKSVYWLIQSTIKIISIWKIFSSMTLKQLHQHSGLIECAVSQLLLFECDFTLYGIHSIGWKCQLSLKKKSNKNNQDPRSSSIFLLRLKFQLVLNIFIPFYRKVSWHF